MIGISVIAAVFLVGIQDGNRTYGDLARVRMLKSSYAMWKDHKLLGVGLANWQKEYADKYILKKEIKKDARQRYLDWKKASEQRAAVAKKAVEWKTKAKKKAVTRREVIRIRAWQNEAIKSEAAFDMPHNVIAWSFSTTGVIGGIGYLLFVLYYGRMFYNKIKENSNERILYVGLWSFLAVTIHGLADAGITNKEAARFFFLILGISLQYSYTKNGKSMSEFADNVY